MPKTVMSYPSYPQRRRETVMPDSAIYSALAAIAAVIEEPYCAVGPDELRGLVNAHSRLSRALGGSVDYAYADGKVLARRNRQVIKAALPSVPSNPTALDKAAGKSELTMQVRSIDETPAAAAQQG